MIDYSQYKAWMKCPHYWYMRYVSAYEKNFPARQRSDAICIGSLVHSGLENWYKHNRPVIDPAVIEEVTPTPETLALCEGLVYAYVQRYPCEAWKLVNVEEAITVTLPGGTTLIAKVDAYFEVHEPITLDTTDPNGLPLVLEPGIWVQEYKTKTPNTSRANYFQAWEVNRQASFQSIALQLKYGLPIKGVVVNVIEKPKIYTPHRKCKGCAESYELGSYIPAGVEGYSCPVCGKVQKLNPYKPKKVPMPDFFRVPVHRPQDTLATHIQEIELVARQMDAMREHGRESVAMNSEVCVDHRYGACEFFNAHVYGQDPADDPNLRRRDPTKYLGLVNIGESV